MPKLAPELSTPFRRGLFNLNGRLSTRGVKLTRTHVLGHMGSSNVPVKATHSFHQPDFPTAAFKSVTWANCHGHRRCHTDVARCSRTYTRDLVWTHRSPLAYLATAGARLLAFRLLHNSQPVQPHHKRS